MDEELQAYFSGEKNLKKCFDLASDIHHSYKGYRLVEDKTHGPRMFLYWCKPDNPKDDANWFPYEMNTDEITSFVWGWLKRVDYGEEPDTDGSTGKGFSFWAKDFCDCLYDGGKPVCDEYSVGVIVKPVWFVYGKGNKRFGFCPV